MTHEEFSKTQSEMPTPELIAKARAWNTKLCDTGGRAWSLRVPVSQDDPDMVFCEVCRRLEHLETMTWLSPVPSERESQEARLKQIWPGYPNVAPDFQHLNGLLAIAEDRFRAVNMAQILLEELERYLPVLERLENYTEGWDAATQGTGIATLNGYRDAIARAKGLQP